jgi:HEAT repeat protein
MIKRFNIAGDANKDLIIMENEQPHPKIEALLEDLNVYGKTAELAATELEQNTTLGTIRRLISLMGNPPTSYFTSLTLKPLFLRIGEKAVPDLVEAVYSPNALVALGAVDILYEMKRSEAFPVLLNFVEQASLSSPARDKAINRLGQIGNMQAVPLLVMAFNKSVAAVETSMLAKVDPFIETITDALLDLWEDGHPTVYQALTSSHYLVRSWVWKTLRIFQRWDRRPYNHWFKDSSELVGLLLPLLKSPYWRERFNIVLLLESHATEDVKEALFHCLTDSSTSVRIVASLALNGIMAAYIYAPPKNYDPYYWKNRFPDILNKPGPNYPLKEHIKLRLLNLLVSDPQPEVRKVAAIVLGQTEEMRAWQPILNAIKEQDELVRTAAIGAATQLSRADFISADQRTALVTLLLGSLSDSRLHVRKAIFLALGQLSSDPRAIPVLGEELLVKRRKPENEIINEWRNLSNDWELSAIIIGLGLASTVEAFAVLTAALKYSNRMVRNLVAEYISKFPGVTDYPPAIEALNYCCNDKQEDNFVRDKAATSLEALKNKKN